MAIKYENKMIKISGFTIVELLIVIVVIAILAALIAASYVGMNRKATIASLQSDLKNSSIKLAIDKANNDSYPATKEAADNGKGLQASLNNTYEYTSNGSTYCLSETSGTLAYFLSSENGVPTPGVCPGHLLPVGYEDGGSGGGGEVALPMGPTSFSMAINIDSIRSMVQTSDGGYAVLGTTYSKYGAGSFDMIMAKYDLDGNVSWSKTLGGTGLDNGYSIIQASDGGYAVTGGTYSYGTGNYDMFLAKYNSVGDLSWTKTWGGAKASYGTSIVQSGDGGYAITGTTESYSAGSSDMFIVKYDPTGNVVWNKTWGGGNNDEGYSIAKTSDAGYVVTGRTWTYGSDMFLAKYDLNGNLLWNKTWGTHDGESLTVQDEGHSVIQTNDGGYIVTGESQYFNSNGDMFLAKFNSAGDLSWSKTWGGLSRDFGKSVIQTSDGGYAVTGATGSYGASSNFDMFLTKYDPAGVLSWSKTWGGYAYDDGVSVTQTNNGGYAIAGVTQNYFSYGSFLNKYDSAGNILNCASPMCQNVSAAVNSPTLTLGSPLAVSSSPSATVNSPTPVVTSPTVTTQVIVAAVFPPPTLTVTFFSQELYVAYPGESQTVCKEWTVPAGNTIKGFLVSQATENNYDFFSVSLDGVQVYNRATTLTNEYVNTSVAPGATLSACITSDGSVQGGYGGEVTGVLYN